MDLRMLYSCTLVIIRMVEEFQIGSKDVAFVYSRDGMDGRVAPIGIYLCSILSDAERVFMPQLLNLS